MTEIVLKVANPAALLKKWNQHIKHGVIFAPVHPVPQEGADAVVTIHPAFSPLLVSIQGYVAQASVGISVVQLRGLDATARERLVELGVAEAADAVVGDEAKSTGSHEPVTVEDAEPAPTGAAATEPAPTAAAEPAPTAAGGSAPTAAAEPAPPRALEADPFMDLREGDPEVVGGVDTEADTETLQAAVAPADAPAALGPAGTDAPKTFKPPAAKFTPGSARFTPGSAKFTPGAAKFTPGAAKFSSGEATFKPRPVTRSSQKPVQAGDLTDVRVVAAIDGPATAGAEPLLPPSTSRGTFGAETWRDVVLRLTTEQATGILVVRAFREIRWAYLVEGGPVHFAGDSPHAGEFLSDALVAEGAITPEVWTEGVRMGKLLGMRPGEYLVGQGRLARSVLDAAITRRAERITRNLIGTNFGSWSFHPVPPVTTVFSNPAVNVVEVLMDAERKTQALRDNDLLIRETEPFYKHHVKMVPARRHLLSRLTLAENEQFVVAEMLQAGWTIGELVAYGGMQERSLLRLLCALMGMGLIEFVEEEGEISKRNRAERILWMGLRDIERRDAFEALCAHWSSTPYELKLGYEKVLGEYGMDRFGDVADDRIKELIGQIRERADSLYKQLSSREGRREARKGRVGPDQLLMAVDLLDKQAQMAVWKNDFPYVKACYERVMDLDPGIAEAAEARKNARTALADPRIRDAKQPGEGRMLELQKQFDALGADD